MDSDAERSLQVKGVKDNGTFGAFADSAQPHGSDQAP